jgi:hypothetical protein
MHGSPPIPPDAPPAHSRLAIWSLVLGILSLTCFSVFAAIPAVICGHKAMGKIKRSGGALGGDGLALAGLITGYLGLALALVMVPLLAAVAIPNFVRARESAVQAVCRINREQIDAAKQRWAVEHKKGDAEVPAEKDLQPYLQDSRLPRCPAGGTYTLNAVNGHPACTRHPAAAP